MYPTYAMPKNKLKDIAFEESLSEDWTRDLDVVEVPLGNKSLLYLWVAILFVGVVFALRLTELGVFKGSLYRVRADANATQRDRIPAPRGLITDRNGVTLAENIAVFTAVLDAKEFLRQKEAQEETLKALEEVLRINKSELWQSVRIASESEFFEPIVLSENLSQPEIIDMRSKNLPSVIIENNFERRYRNGPVFAPVVGYTGRVCSDDLKRDPRLGGGDFVGRAGIE